MSVTISNSIGDYTDFDTIGWDTNGSLVWDYAAGIVPDTPSTSQLETSDMEAYSLTLGTFSAPGAALNHWVCQGNTTCGFLLPLGIAFLGLDEADIFEGYEAPQGFSGVYDAATGDMLLIPSTYDDVVPEGWVSAQGGHAEVSATLGGNPSNQVGFAAVLQEDGSVQLTWTSGTLNPEPTGFTVPMNLRPTITQAVQGLTTRTVTP